VTVIDNKTGKPVRDLTERDFTITENGVRQTVTAFSPEVITAESAATVVPETVVRGRGVGPRDRRIFMIVLHGA
jgi:hypothetical protein